MKQSITRGDLNDARLNLAYDAASRLLAAQRQADASNAFTAGLPQQWSFRYDEAQNLLERSAMSMHLSAHCAPGNTNPGIGTRNLGGGFFELRGRNAGRVIVRRTGSNSFDIVGKFQGHVRGDAANSQIIRRLIEETQ